MSNLIEAMGADEWQRNGVLVDFGPESQAHHRAIHHGVREGQITPEQLDIALGEGKELTRLAHFGADQSAPGDHLPHRLGRPGAGGGKRQVAPCPLRRARSLRRPQRDG
jgi:hypothetical protein